jgi:GTP pyrophosphokinase
MEDLLAALGRGDVTPRQLGLSLHEEAPVAGERPLFAPRAPSQEQGGILVHGISKLLTSTAKCCKPLPPEPIIGFVTRGRGITVHRQDCPNVLLLDEAGQRRLINADWGGGGGVFPAELEVRAHDRQGLLRDISEVLSREKINVTATNTESRTGVARMRFTVEVRDIAQLGRVLTLIHEVPSVLECRRR